MLRQGWYVMKGGTLQHAVCITKEETGSRGMMITDGGGWQRADEAQAHPVPGPSQSPSASKQATAGDGVR